MAKEKEALGTPLEEILLEEVTLEGLLRMGAHSVQTRGPLIVTKDSRIPSLTTRVSPIREVLDPTTLELPTVELKREEVHLEDRVDLEQVLATSSSISPTCIHLSLRIKDLSILS